MRRLPSPRRARPLLRALLRPRRSDWDQAGKKPGAQTEASPNLMGPHRLVAGLGSVKISFIASGCTSAHCIALAQDGAAFAWGRNEAGQLGMGDTITRPGPAPIQGLASLPVAAAATGKAHTLFVRRARLQPASERCHAS